MLLCRSTDETAQGFETDWLTLVSSHSPSLFLHSHPYARLPRGVASTLNQTSPVLEGTIRTDDLYVLPCPLLLRRYCLSLLQITYMEDLKQCECCGLLTSDCEPMGRGYESELCFECRYLDQKLEKVRRDEEANSNDE